LPALFVPMDQQALLAACPGGFCTPDDLIRTGGQTVPDTCVSVAGAEGRCLSTCLQAIADQPLLPQSTCAADERCAPCFNPTADDPTLSTGACDLACDAPVDPPVVLDCPWTGPPVLDPGVLPDCDVACGGAHCLDASQVPPAQQAQLSPCTGGFCVPDKIIAAAGNNLPKTCAPFSGVPAEGRCQSTCLPAVAAQASSLRQDNCDAGELCTPCYDPFTGVATGACSSSPCDAPTQPPYLFPACCPSTGGTCVPTSSLPDDQEANLNQLTCPAQTLCVPNEYLPNSTVPIPTCNALIGQGACVSECVDVPGIFSQRNCPNNYVCVGCWLAPNTPGCP
jgi:hypothetical protein